VRTPIKMPIKVGAHSIVLRDNGVDVWKQDLVAQPTVEYEYAPSMEPAKQRERDQRKRATVPAPRAKETESKQPAPPAPVAPTETRTGSASPPTTTLPPAQPATPASITTPAPSASSTAPAAPAVTPAVVSPAPAPPAPTPPPPAPARTVTVPPTAVTKISGAPPEISQHKGADIPASVASKVCISPTGRVSSVEVITKLDSRVAADILRALQGWTYQPYQVDGAPTTACFVVSFKLK